MLSLDVFEVSEYIDEFVTGIVAGVVLALSTAVVVVVGGIVLLIGEVVSEIDDTSDALCVIVSLIALVDIGPCPLSSVDAYASLVVEETELEAYAVVAA